MHSVTYSTTMAWPRWYHITLTIHSHLHARTHMQNDAHRRLLTAVYVSWTEASGYNVQLLTRPHQHHFYGYHTPHKLTTITQTACSKRNKGRITKHPVTNKDVDTPGLQLWNSTDEKTNTTHSTTAHKRRNICKMCKRVFGEYQHFTTS